MPDSDHFERGQPRAGAHELRRDGLGFGRKDVFLQPLHQREVVGQAAIEHHGRVRVGVDQARHDHLPARVDRLRRRGTACLMASGVSTPDDVAAVDRDGPGIEHPPLAVDGDDGAVSERSGNLAGSLSGPERAEKARRRAVSQRASSKFYVQYHMAPVPFHLVDHPLAHDALAELRDARTTPPAFRAAAHRISLIVAAERCGSPRRRPTPGSTPIGPAGALHRPRRRRHRAGAAVPASAWWIRLEAGAPRPRRRAHRPAAGRRNRGGLSATTRRRSPGPGRQRRGAAGRSDAGHRRAAPCAAVEIHRKRQVSARSACCAW